MILIGTGTRLVLIGLKALYPALIKIGLYYAIANSTLVKISLDYETSKSVNFTIKETVCMYEIPLICCCVNVFCERLVTH